MIQFNYNVLNHEERIPQFSRPSLEQFVIQTARIDKRSIRGTQPIRTAEYYRSSA